MNTNFENSLLQYSESDWLETIKQLSPSMHEVDRNATDIWFRFYPLALHKYLETATDKTVAVQQFVMQGNYELDSQIDSSHNFLYGNRFWKVTKDSLIRRAENSQSISSLNEEILSLSKEVAAQSNVDQSLTVGITAVGLMTLNQVGLDSFKNSPGTAKEPQGLMKNSPSQIVAERAKDDSQGLLGFLKTVNKEWSVRYDETENRGKFKLMNDEEIASGAARDQSQNWLANDPRCGEGVIPVECRSAACGTCWIGILAGAEKLSEVGARERKQMKVFGYNQGEESKPIMRLACQAKAYGAVTIVIPPWNGVFGKKVYGNVADVELEPATTSAAKLRETISSAMDD